MAVKSSLSGKFGNWPPQTEQVVSSGQVWKLAATGGGKGDRETAGISGNL
jgi:hypothetical protein